MTIKEAVLKILQESPKARANDNYLIYRVYRLMNWPMNLAEIAKEGENKFESIRRERARAQKLNPFLLPNREITKLRKAKEERFRNEMRGI